MKLTKAYIVEKKDNTYKVRIPIYHGIEGSSNATTDDELPYATVATIKGAANIYTAGDIVYVDFEENDLSKPVIIGGLLLDKKTNSTLDIDFDSINVKTRAILPATTTIGNVTATELGTLKGISKNIQKQFNDILNYSSTYDATYITNQFDDNAKWILEDNGLIVQSNFLDENTEQQIDSLAYIQATKKTGSKTFVIDEETTLYQSDGYDKDYRLRLNWQGVNVIKNDAVKMSMGLYARNYWNLEGNVIGVDAQGNKILGNLAQPEYTWRPTIQSYTNRRDLSQAEINANTYNEKKINTGYFPYSMQLNPDGGDVLIGRGGLVTVVDHQDDAWVEGQTIG